MRRLAAAVLLVCAFAAAPAGAATVGVYDDPDASAVALAGPDAVVLRQATAERSQLVAVARGGGKPQTVLTVKRMNFVFENESRRLAASAARVALIAEIEDARDRTVEWRVYSGPPRGPIRVVRALPVREAWVPSLVDVDGDRLLIVEARPENDGPIRALLFDSRAGLVSIPWARASALPIEISGGYAAASMAGPNRVAVLDLATGAELVTVPLSARERGTDLSLAPDGRVAVVTQAGVRVAGPGAAARLVPGTNGLKRVHLRGGTLSGIDTRGRAVALPVSGGRITTLGPPTGVFVDAAGDASGYAWLANGCARVAAIPISTAPRRSGDPCPTTEIAYAYIASTTLRGRTITVPVGCIAAPRGVCRGTAIARIFEGDGKAAATGRFAIRVGKSREVKMRVTRAALEQFRREGYGNLVMDARIPNGRIGVGSDGNAELSVDLPGHDVVAFAAQSPETLTPEGPATLYSDWHGAMTLEGEHPELLTGFRVVVQPGGRAGTIRFLVQENPPFDDDARRVVHVGPPVTLPAEPGTYTFPAPHVFADYRDVTYGIEQETGGHAITAQIRCEPEDGESDVCNSQSVDVYRPPLGGALPDRRTATEVHRGRELTIEPITESDIDGDGAGDQSEDRTNLRASATTQRLKGHRRAFDITVENAGPRTADRPQVEAYLLPSPGLGAWNPACVGEPRQFFSGSNDDDPRKQYCTLAPLAVGERRTVRLVVPDLGFGDAYFSLSAEGRDLAGGDESGDPEVRGPRPPLSLEVPARPESIGNGIPITVRATRKGRVRLQVRRGSRTYTRTITMRRKRDVMLRPPRRLARETGVVTITARSGGATARARVQPSY